MRYTIEGFSQEYAVSLRKTVFVKNKEKQIKIDCTDLVILRWFVDFYPSMKKMSIDGREYAWLSHKKMLEDLPLLDISRRACIERMQKLVEFEILDYKLIKENGTFSLYAFGKNYIKLVEKNNNEGVRSNDIGVCVQPTQGIRSNDIGVCVQPDNKDYSIKDKSIKYSSIKNKAAMLAGDLPTTSYAISDMQIDTKDNDEEENLINQIASLYFNITGRMCNAKDYISITQVIEKTQDVELISKTMQELNNRYKPQFTGDKIHSFKYFVDAIIEAVQKQKDDTDINVNVKYFDDDELDAEFNKFLEYRKNIRKPVYDVDELVNRLKCLDSDVKNQIAILKNSIANGWNGIFPLESRNKHSRVSVSSYASYSQRETNYDDMRSIEKAILEKTLREMGRSECCS